jgi:hypothetical protein
MIDDSPVEADWTAGELRQRLRNVISTMLGAIESGEAGAQMRDVTLCIADLALACANLKDERYD